MQQKTTRVSLTATYTKKWLRGPDLNRQPSGYEPDELPDCSTPRYSFEKWWREKDSNLRRRRQQIYSLPPLAGLGIPPRKTIIFLEPVEEIESTTSRLQVECSAN